jgi:large-conductance mechanosensitive channel
MIFLSGLGAIFVAIFDAILISLPIFILLLLIKTFNKAARIDQVEQEVKKLREEVQSLHGELPGAPKK